MWFSEYPCVWRLESRENAAYLFGRWLVTVVFDGERRVVFKLRHCASSRRAVYAR